MKGSRLLGALTFGLLVGWAVTLYARDEHPSDLFKQYCAKCHGEDGRAETERGKKVKARNFTDAEWQQGKTDAELIDSVTNGKEDDMRLFVSPGHSNHSLIEGFTAANGILEIPTISIDAFAEKRGIAAIDFIKMDIEGAETMALNGMREMVRKSPRPVLLAECNPLALRTAGTNASDYMRLIEDLGLRSRAILDDGRLGPLPDIAAIEASISLYVNLLCAKPGDPRLSELAGPVG